MKEEGEEVEAEGDEEEEEAEAAVPVIGGAAAAGPGARERSRMRSTMPWSAPAGDRASTAPKGSSRGGAAPEAAGDAVRRGMWRAWEDRKGKGYGDAGRRRRVREGKVQRKDQDEEPCTVPLLIIRRGGTIKRSLFLKE